LTTQRASFVHIFTAHAQKRLFRSFRSKIWPRHSLLRPRFLIRQMYFHYRMTFTGYIRCFVLLRRITLWPWPFDHESASCRVLLMSEPHTNFYNPTTIGHW